MFTNKYSKTYFAITSNAKQRITEGYSELHHIIPQSMGGSNDKDNLVELTAREHFICHWLLVKMTEGDDRSKMLYALKGMKAENKYQQRYQTKITARVYATYRAEYAKIKSNMMTGDSNCSRRPGVGEKIRQAKLGVKRAAFSDEWIEKMAEKKRGSSNPRFGVEVTQSTRDKIREKATGRKQSPETVAKKAAAIRGLHREKILCPHCGKSVAVNGYPRWHGPNCRSRNK